MDAVQNYLNLYLTVIDCKVLNTLTGTNSTQACPICERHHLMFEITEISSVANSYPLSAI